jgi:predicted small secreted protein
MKAMMVVVALLALAGCNTVNGVGQDISGGAETVQNWF